MRRQLHVILALLFIAAWIAESMFWAGAASLPQTGPLIRQSIHREAPLVLTYTVGGETLGEFAPSLIETGRGWAAEALEPGFERILQDPSVAAALIFGNTWNGTHRLAKFGILGAPFLLLLAVIAWFMRPPQIRMMGKRR